MNKTDLIAAVAEKSELSKKDAEKAVGALLSAIEDSLKTGEKVSIVGFGTFEAKVRPRSQRPQSADPQGNRYSGFQAAHLQGWQGPQRFAQLKTSRFLTPCGFPYGVSLILPSNAKRLKTR